MPPLSFDDCLKDKDAQANQISQEEAAGGLFDAVRYTQISDDKSMTENCKKTIETLNRSGYNIVGVKNTWNDPGNPYSGVNMKVISQKGQKFELQFHTRDSLRVKEEIHGLYERQGEMKKSSPEWKNLQQQMMAISGRQKRPDSVETIGRG